MESFFLIISKAVGEKRRNVIQDSLKILNNNYIRIFANDKIGIALESFVDYKATSIIQNSKQLNCYFFDEASGCSIITDSRIDYRNELIEKLGFEWKVADGFSDSKLILFAYLKWEKACVKNLFGDYSFVIWDPGRHQIFCARDHFGCRPLYYIDHNDYMAVSSRISAFKNLPGFKLEIREQYILDSICSIEINSDESPYKGIHRLKPAHYIKCSLAKVPEQSRYWDLKVDMDYAGLTLEEAHRGLRERIFDSVRQRSCTKGQIGVELSGGLDSSGIASVLAKEFDRNIPLFAFTHSISSEGAAQQPFLKSELKYSKFIADNFSSILQFVVTEENSPGNFETLKDAVYQMVKPISRGYAMNSDLLLQTANRQGVTVMFSGFGGDEGITVNGGVYFNELIKSGQSKVLRDNIRIIIERGGGSLYLKLIMQYIKYYAPWAYILYREDWRKSRYRSFALQKTLARKYRMKRRYFKTTTSPRNPDIRALQYFRILNPNIPERIEKTLILAQKLGIEYRYPFLDVKLIEFFYSLPSEYKYMDGQGRYLFRKALEGILPDRVRLRVDKGGATIPNVRTRIFKDFADFQEIIREGRQNNKYHYVDYKRLQEMLDAFSKMSELKRWDFVSSDFISPISVLILQKWQREGKIDIGIKC